MMTTRDLVRECRKALEASNLPAREHIAHLVELGWIDRKGRVTTLLGGSAEPEPEAKSRNGRRKRS